MNSWKHWQAAEDRIITKNLVVDRILGQVVPGRRRRRRRRRRRQYCGRKLVTAGRSRAHCGVSSRRLDAAQINAPAAVAARRLSSLLRRGALRLRPPLRLRRRSAHRLALLLSTLSATALALFRAELRRARDLQSDQQEFSHI